MASNETGRHQDDGSRRLSRVLPATVFQSDEGNIVILALGVAGITYGGLLGVFVFGMVNKRATAVDANITFALAVAVNAFFFVMEKYITGEVWVAWQWYPLLGVIVMVVVGGLLSLRHPKAQTRSTVAEVEAATADDPVPAATVPGPAVADRTAQPPQRGTRRPRHPGCPAGDE